MEDADMKQDVDNWFEKYGGLRPQDKKEYKLIVRKAETELDLIKKKYGSKPVSEYAHMKYKSRHPEEHSPTSTK